MMLILLALAAPSPVPQLAAELSVCKTDLDCSLNGVCTGSSCVCDSPWAGAGCGVLQ